MPSSAAARSTLRRSAFAPAVQVSRAARAAVGGLAIATLLVSSLLGLTSVSASAAAATAGAMGGQQHVEARIQEMHARLKITAAQEELWKPVAQTMRDNQLALEPLIADRERNAKTATAVEDLRSFAEVSEAHASGIRKFAAVFEPLYAAMAESQKKDADTLFRSGAGKMGKSK